MELVKPERRQAEMGFKLTDEEGIFLVKLARRAVEENLKDGRVKLTEDILF